jgi:histidinol-phosphate aminotransferase
MSTLLTSEQKRDLMSRGFSRRHFARIAAFITGGAALPFYNEPALAQLSMVRNMPPDAVKINANENPMGPCKEALEVIYKMTPQGGRYRYEDTFDFRDIMAECEGLKPSYVQPFAGSSAPLHQTVLAFTSPTRSFVTADPGYEAGEHAARFIGAKVIHVPLTKTYAHDVKKMATADPNAGVIYLCNPNNPTGTLTPHEDIMWLADHKPKGTILMIDEAYIQIAGAPICTSLVQQDKDVVILRTFSKIYGMAGLRAGVAMARPDLLEKIRPYTAGALPCTAMDGATASLKAKYVVPERREIIKRVRENVFAFMDKHNFEYIPSVANHFMANVHRPGQEVAMAMRKEKVYIGRVWPSWPTYVRISIGTQAEMDKFKTAFLKVMG